MLIKATDPKIRKRDIMVSLAFLVVAAILAWAGFKAWTWWKYTPVYVDSQEFPIQGIDVSNHNGMMNLEATAEEDDIKFVIIKASEGVTHKDKNFRLNYEKALDAGILTGAYHYFRFDCGGAEQARNLLQAVGDRSLPLGLFIDVEEHGNAQGVSPDKIAKRLTVMMEYLNLAGHRVTIYTNTDGFYKYIEPTLPGVDLWLCYFKPTPPAIPNVWFWQYSHNSRLAGIKGDVDRDAFIGNRADLDKFISDHNLSPKTEYIPD